MLSACLSQPPPVDPKRIVVAIGGDNQIVGIDLASHRTLATRRIVTSSHVPTYAGHYIAWNSAHNESYVVLSTSDGSTVAAVAWPNNHVVWTRRLPDTAGIGRTVAVDSRNAHILVISDHSLGSGIQGFGPRAEPVATIIRAADGALIDSTILEHPSDDPREPNDWDPLQAAFVAQTGTLWVSYHNQGLFEYSAREGSALTDICSVRPCIQAHGDFAVVGGVIVVATGGRQLNVTDFRGQPQVSLDSSFTRNHLMTFAVDAATNTLYAAGSCKYEPGLVAINIRSAAKRVIQPEGPQSKVCGDVVRYVRDGLFVASDTKITSIDTSTGRALWSYPFMAIDLA